MGWAAGHSRGARLTSLLSLSWVLRDGAAEGIPVTLRLLSLPKIGRSQGAPAMIHIGVTPPSDKHIVPASPERIMCVSVNGSSAGCFQSNSPNGALVPVKQPGIAWITGHFRTAAGNKETSRPLAVNIAAIDIDEAPDERQSPQARPSRRPDEQQSRSWIGDEVGGAFSSRAEAHYDASPVSKSPSGRLSAVLLLTLEDVHLAMVLLATLQACRAMDLFHDFFVIVPSQEIARFNEMRLNARFNTDSIVVVDEKELLPGGGGVEPWWEKYALQMALKLLASSLVRTPYYLTLDADVLCTKATLTEEDLLPRGKGNYVPEGRHVHPRWWYGSAKTLGVDDNPQGEGFGVTPAVMSTVGSMLALGRLRELYGRDNFLNRMFYGFAQAPERWWSEYTIYRTALDYFGAFDILHAVGPTRLLGDSVWYAEAFESWNTSAVFNDDPAAFVVVQSTAGISLPRLVGAISKGGDFARSIVRDATWDV